MSKKSPKEIVVAEHGSKAELAEKVLAVLDRPEDGEEATDFDNNIRTMSNRKLLRLYSAHQLMTTKFGSKEDLVGQVVKARFPNGNGDYETKVSGFTVPKLLDLARQAGLVKPGELRWR